MIYLDSAATSLYKPERVHLAVIRALNEMASPGRGAHAAAMKAAECCYDCREKLAKFFHMQQSEKVIFTFNATHGLNIAINSLVKEQTKVLISGYEHNSVTRPLYARKARVTVIDTPLFEKEKFIRRTEEQIRRMDVVICTHVSNAFGYILPIEEIAALCRHYHKPLIIDASQSAGVLDLDFDALGASFAAMPGHKGLLGPQGTGVLLCKNDALPLLYGGSGSASAEPTMPDYFPDRLEAGTHNVAGIAGLSAGVDFLMEKGTAFVRQKERALLEQMKQELSNVPDLKLFYSDDPELQCSVLSVLPLKMSCEALADALSSKGVAVRTGLHCAPTAHKTAGTFQTGTLRFSFSPFNTPAHIERAAEICKKTLKNA